MTEKKADPRLKLVPEWNSEDPYTQAAVAALREQAPELFEDVLASRAAKGDPTHVERRPKPTPKPEPTGPSPEERASWERAAIGAGALETALPDVLHRIEHELPHSVSLVDPTSPHATLAEFLAGLKADAVHLFGPEPQKGNGHDRHPDPWE